MSLAVANAGQNNQYGDSLSPGTRAKENQSYYMNVA
jgi:hypothetical protein